MFALSGIPPTAGFFAKLYVFLAAIDVKLTGLAVIGVVTSVVSAFYYLRVVKVMYFDEASGAFDRPITAELKGVVFVTAVVTLFFFLVPGADLRRCGSRGFGPLLPVTGSQPTFPAGYRLVCYDSVGSTNDEAKRLARKGAADGTLVWALEQTAGRGRRGRTWVSPPGNLYASLILRPDCPAQQAAQLGFVAALAIGDASARSATGSAP